MNRPKVGVGVLLMKDNCLLLGKRKNAHGAGTWSLPGGHLEYGESFAACASREVYEETGLICEDVILHAITNDVFTKEMKHYVTIFMKATSFSGNLEVKEPQKCSEWKWFSLQNLPENIFLPLKNLQASANAITL
jgi:8-oxo-dGTP diphosphatase